jgi:hypothetical protein
MLHVRAQTRWKPKNVQHVGLQAIEAILNGHATSGKLIRSLGKQVCDKFYSSLAPNRELDPPPKPWGMKISSILCKSVKYLWTIAFKIMPSFSRSADLVRTKAYSLHFSPEDDYYSLVRFVIMCGLFFSPPDVPLTRVFFPNLLFTFPPLPWCTSRFSYQM